MNNIFDLTIFLYACFIMITNYVRAIIPCTRIFPTNGYEFHNIVSATVNSIVV